MEILRDKIAVVGIGETEYSWKLDRGAKELIFEAVHKALDDAKLTPQDIDGIVTETDWLRQFITHNELADALGINYRFSGGIAGTGIGSIAGFYIAAMAIVTGQADTVLTYFTNGYGSFYAPWLKNASGERREDLFKGVKGSFEAPYGSNGPRIYFPQVAMRYMHEYGLTEEQFSRQLGAIAVDHRKKAILNGKGVMKDPLTLEDYLNSPMVADPLRLPDFCRWNDGACAWIMTSAERAKDFPHVPVYATGFGYSWAPGSWNDYWTQGQKGKNYIHKPHMAVALDRALQMAGITRQDLDFAQIYDAFTIMLLVFFESLGFCKYGEGGAFAESGGMSLEGSMPVNTHGGHLSHSYLNLSSHIVEAIKQLRGEAGAGQIKDAKFGMFESGTPFLEYVTILRRD
jgi:acetyl-CoA acetyltransferase